MNGTDLLADFRKSRSEEAFGEIVRRYTNLVYSVARRRLSNVSLAREVTQIVFIRLAKAVPTFRGDAELVAWLHRTTVHVSINLWRSENRRRAREEQAAAMQPDPNENAGWNEMAPVLDEALNQLNDADRQTILLRFFDDKSMRDVGVLCGISEDAAKMRVSRAVERLRTQLGARGLTCGAMALGTMLSERSVEAAPNALVVALMSLSFPVPAGVGAAAGFFGPLLHVARMKLVAGLAATVLVGIVAFMVFRSQEHTNQVAVGDAPQSDASNGGPNRQVTAATAQETNTGDQAREPDPRKLLQAVARARQRIGSGSMELQLATERLQNGQMETNHLRLSALFDGQKLRWEQVGKEYRYTAMGDAGVAQEARIKKEGLDRAAAIGEGLLQRFEARYVTAYDGAALLTYRETDGKSADTVIDDPKRGSVEFIFDPRCLGLRAFLSVGSTVENCLGYSEAKSIKLVGQESVEGIPAWHVQVLSKHDESLDFWMEVAQPTRVLRHAKGPDVVVSKYDSVSIKHPIPTEVTTTEYRNGSPYFNKRFIQASAQFEVPVEPASFTLAGLGMAVGSTVTDVRDHQRIIGLGYWTGAGLEEFPTGKKTQQQSPPNVDELLALLENYPATPEALDAARWVLLNTPDGPEVEKAAEVILREHTRDTNLVSLCPELERLRHRCSKPLLEALLKDNPSADVRGTACFALATMSKHEAKYGQNKKATAEAEKLFQQVMAEFSQVKQRGWKLEELAKPELSELRRLTIGKVAPEIEGEDLNGQKMRLSDYRGKVVVLAFWWISYIEAPEHRKLVERMTGKPFAFIGVYGDEDLAKGKAEVEKYDIIWPSFWDGRSGPISTAWNVRSWPNIWVLDRKGVIRYRGVRGSEIGDAVDALLRE